MLCQDRYRERVVDSKQSYEDAPHAKLPRAQDSETVVDSKQNSDNVPRATASTCRKPTRMSSIPNRVRGRLRARATHQQDASKTTDRNIGVEVAQNSHCEDANNRKLNRWQSHVAQRILGNVSEMLMLAFLPKKQGRDQE